MSDMPNYRKPPVVEVAIGVQFAPITKLTVPYVGLFWDRIRETFVRAEEQGPLPHIVEPPPPEPQFILMDKPELPRTWFLNEKGDRILQVQRDRLHYNWRKVQPEDQYPRYPIVKREFFDYWTCFCAFLKEQKFPAPVIDQCELVYVNHIPKEAGWSSVSELSDVFSFFRWVPREGFLPTPDALRWSMRFSLPEKAGWLNCDCVPARVVPEGPEVMRLSLTARGCPSGNINDETLEKWFDMAREWIVRGFVDLTAKQTDKLWEPRS